jgi:RNA polymerase sigma-70 factor (ECF subfamily)
VSLDASRVQDLSDEELMARYARGEETAFEVLVSRYRKPLFGFLARYLGRTDKAEDVFQEVFFEVIRVRTRYRPGHRFASWLYRIARNRAVDRLRRNGFREMESLDDPLEGAGGETRLGTIAGSNPDPEAVVSGGQLAKVLDRALASLPPEQREVLWLKERSGLSLSEVAELLGVSENTVKSRLRYALEKVRSQLLEHGFAP